MDRRGPDKSATDQPISAVESERAWQELQGFVASIDRLARTETSPDAFQSELVNGLVETLAAQGAAMWLVLSDEEVNLEYSTGLESGAEGSFDPKTHRHLATVVAQQGKLQYLAPSSDSTEDQLSNDGPFGAYLVPIINGRTCVGVLELIQRGGLSPAGHRGHERLLTTLAEIAADFHARQEVARLRRFQLDANRLFDFLESTHSANGDLKQVGDRIADGAVQLLDTDRTSVHVRRRFGLRLLSVSGASRFDPRSNALRTLRRLAREFGRQPSKQPIQYPDDSAADLRTSLAAALDAHITETGAKGISLYPLEHGPGPQSYNVGVLIAERFSEWGAAGPSESLQQRLVRQASNELHRALMDDRLVFGSVQRRLANSSWFSLARTGLKVVLLLGLLAVAIWGLLFHQSELQVRVQGQLQPAVSRDVFAPEDGEVAELLTEDGAIVSESEVLLRLHSPTLDLQYQQIVGDLETARKRLDGVRSARVRLSPTDEQASTRRSQLSAEEQELEELLASKQQELELLRKQRDSLAIRSPLHGQVMTWDAARQLQNRPVRRGQSLLQVADTAGDWKVELSVLQRDLGYLQQAMQGPASPLALTFSLATDPSVPRRATIQAISNQVAWNEAMQGHVVEVTAKIEQPLPRSTRPGSVVYGRIGCGLKPLGYVWLHQIIDRITGEWRLATWNEEETQ